MAAVYPVQGKSYQLVGGGCSDTDTSIGVVLLQTPTGTDLAMASFGSIGYATIEPATSKEENISFTGITNNSNGTSNLTGCTRGLRFVTPYTVLSGLALAHAGGAVIRLTNSVQFYAEFGIKKNDETVTGLWTFPNNANTPQLGTVYAAPTLDLQAASKKYVDTVAISGAPDANTTTKGIVQIATQAQVDAGTATGSTAASLVPTPAILRSRLLSDYIVDTGAADAYAIAPSPAITAYATGQRFNFKAVNANTTASTLAVSGLASPKNIFKNGAFALVAGDIRAGGIYEVEYDGTQFQLLSELGRPQVSQNGSEIYAATSSGNDTYAVTIAPTFTLLNGTQLRVKLDVANTGAATLNVNAGGALSIVKGISTALETGDLLANQVVTLEYNSTGTVWQIVQTPAALTSGITTPITTNHAHKQSAVWAQKDVSEATGATSYAHNLGVTPNWVRVTMQQMQSATLRQSFGRYERVAATYVMVGVNGTAPLGVNNQNSIAKYDDGSTNTNVATVTTLDATNVGLTWTKANSPTGTVDLMIEVGI